jgi:hypothetical protein
MLVFHPAFYLSSYILPRDPQEKLGYKEALKKPVSFEPVGGFISSHFGIPRDRKSGTCSNTYFFIHF